MCVSVGIGQPRSDTWGLVGVGALKGICLILLCKTELYYTSLQFLVESLLKVWISPLSYSRTTTATVPVLADSVV